ncbi:hypothetical protein Ddc_21105 [Ditylenchus destructor]|nr:hypothetical protein Ddc_21105 [Ditylenchus destructor]
MDPATIRLSQIVWCNAEMEKAIHQEKLRPKRKNLQARLKRREADRVQKEEEEQKKWNETKKRRALDPTYDHPQEDEAVKKARFEKGAAR